MRCLATKPGFVLAMLFAVVGAGACNFEAAGSNQFELNVCKVQEDCSSEAECRNGMCMALATDTPLSIALEVTPRRTASANEALSFLFDPFLVEKPILRDFELPASIVVRGVVRDAGKPLAAGISFTPTTSIPGVAVKAITASTGTSGILKDVDYQVELFSGIEYRMLVRPTDAQHPPVYRTFMAGPDVGQDVEYTALEMDQRSFAISGGPKRGDVLLTAFDQRTGEPISSTATVAAGKATLAFAPDAGQFRLEIRASQTATTGLAAIADSTPCDSGAPEFPVFNVKESDLAIDSSGIARIQLPDPPERIRYEGSVELCPEDPTLPAMIGNLPITLRSRSLMVEQPTGLVASYNATTNASFDAGAQQLRFCVEVMPGEYDIVVTPPSGTHCSLFAERRPIQAPGVTGRAVGTVLELPPTTYLTGTLQTAEAAPLKGAAIDGVALGSGGVELPSDDRRVTRFNRSRQATTDAKGDFKLPVDLGGYDIVIKPPIGSGFPWQIRHDVDIAGNIDEFATTITMLSPVSLDGMLKSTARPDEARLAGAAIEAYALVSDGLDGRRAISIGKATAGADGRFTILLPPSTKRAW